MIDPKLYKAALKFCKPGKSSLLVLSDYVCIFSIGTTVVMEGYREAYFRHKIGDGVIAPACYNYKALQAINPTLSDLARFRNELDWPLRESPTRRIGTINDISMHTFCSKEVFRPSMAAVLVSDEAVSTDGYRMMITKESLSEPILIPSALAKYCKGVDIHVGDMNMIEGVNFEIFFNPIDEKYPNYKNVIPNGHPKQVEFKTAGVKDFLAKGAKLATSSSSEAAGVLVNIKGTEMTLSYYIGDAQIVETFPCVGEPITLKFNIKYLLGCLIHPTTIMCYDTTLRAVTFEGDPWCLCMPMRLE